MKAGPDSLNAKLRQFFENNPDELLTYSDIRVKFGASEATMKATLENLRKQGVLRTERIVMAAGR